ncbi:N-acetylglucosaminyl transferase [Alishewanella sp. SMS8]|uniref:N-acetylglucosaminyl transferase n=1 Tax=Alishewanella sp. SMS8 TaxID=2994676 RepID=UPI0027414016|nr:N-acetylglucosaminyl transferase [Alishewanella sp. SMS8]MDP4946483.1 N-acetylglucosaminyl transferase [Alishewanella sp.]MDP5186642.1 N-acetylglucosaminyl transferase [Alishewanella sp.]MDP5460664.1 N-acetylglucosaminyl transferase [Alishewanella sp. SMS8]
MGQNSLKHKELKGRANITRNLSSGLNFLLTDQEDKAIEQLLELLDIEAATIDTYLALANLFRRKGDWDKAIRIHEKLHQLKLPKVQAQHIQFELAKDYYSAGLYDRAEHLLLQLVNSEALREASLKQLFSIFMATHELSKAVALTTEVANTQSKSLRIALANLHTESLKGAALDLTILAELAERYPQAIRPRFELAKLALTQHDAATAKGALLSILKQKPQWSADILPQLSQCHLDEDEWYQLLTLLADKHHNTSARLLLCDWLTEHGSITAAEHYVLDKLRQQPNIRLFQKLLQIRQQQSAQAAEVLSSVEELVNAYLASKILYSCRSCGFKTRQPYWLCPSCQQWETVEPIAGVDGR